MVSLSFFLDTFFLDNKIDLECSVVGSDTVQAFVAYVISFHYLFDSFVTSLYCSKIIIIPCPSHDVISFHYLFDSFVTSM